MSQQVTLNHDGFILGVPSAELQGPGVYLVDDGHVVSFAPLPAATVEQEQFSDASTPALGTLVVTAQAHMNGG